MNSGRFRLLGLGQPRSQWFSDAAQWTTSGMIAADFSKCVSIAELRSRLSGVQPHSAVLIESRVMGLDRDLLDLARSVGVAVIVVETTTTTVNWVELGASAVIHAPLTPSVLLETLTTHASRISDVASVSPTDAADSPFDIAPLFVVCGAGGTGSSTLAIALAQGLSGLTVLCDFARNAEQAMLHDATALTPAIEDLVDGFRTTQASSAEVRSLTFAIETRGYNLLLGQRRTGAWSAMPPRASESAVIGLRMAFGDVVADITADFEDESEGGSIDVEERNALARITARNATVVLVVGRCGLKGVHSLGRVIRDLRKLGVEAERILPVFNEAPKKGLARSASARTLMSLSVDLGDVNSPIFVPHQDVEGALHDGTLLPKRIVAPLVTAVSAVSARVGTSPIDLSDATPIRPGTFGLSA